MGGAVKNITKALNPVDPGGNNFLGLGSKTGRIVAGISTGGLSEGARVISPGGIQGLSNSAGGNFNAPNVPYAPQIMAPQLNTGQNPLEILTASGGAPLLADIAMGADVKNTILSYFNDGGQSYDQWIQQLPVAEQNAVNTLQNQLTSIQNNTNTQNQAVQQLVQDYPNIMTQKIQQYQNVADPAIQKMMGIAMQNLSAQQAAGGQFSSGATAQAAANIGAQYAGDELNYATQLAQQDWNNQYSAATALQNFQQKMLGQGATQGFNAVQNALARNQQLNIAQGQLNQQANITNAQLQQGVNLATGGFQNQANQLNAQQSNGMFGALGGLAGGVLGGIYGGPVGGVAGSTIGSTVGSNLFGGGSSGFNQNIQASPIGAPRLNLPGFTGSYGATGMGNA